jgi:predicted  nucleic acid-binding Zn-ribbon protein
MMVTQLKKRLEELKDEYSAGEKMLQKMEADAADLKSTMLRIKDAITVLEEALEEKLSGNQDH